MHDGVEFRFLNNPERFDADGTLTLRVMSLGEPDEKGRRRPVETNETVTLLVDSLITAIGEQQDTEALNAMGVPLDKNGWRRTARTILHCRCCRNRASGDRCHP